MDSLSWRHELNIDVSAQREFNMFDYVIVGAGSAGCVLANRLSENPGTSVLLLEAGGRDDKLEIRIPAAFPKLFKSPLDWAYDTEPQDALGGRKLYWPRGKVVGGTSSINIMIYIRGHRADYDGWRDRGNAGWGFVDVLPYFLRAEHQMRGPSEFHGTAGPLIVDDLRYTNPLSHAFINAAIEAGFQRNADFNGPRQDGFGFYQVTQTRDSRHSAAAAYLHPALKRPNLTLETDAHVTQVIFEQGRAVGVSYVDRGQRREARARREVILSGGTVNSPQLLMLSGIGPADQLQELGIPIVADRPGVGRNLQDHLVAGIIYECVKPVSLDKAETLRNFVTYLLRRRGPMTSNIAEAGGFVTTRQDLSMPDLQFHFVPVYYMRHGFDNPDGYGFSVGATQLRPQSRGTITLRSSDPFQPPRIQPNYLTSGADMDALVPGTKIARRICQASPFDPYRGMEHWPGEAARSDDAIAEHIRQTVETVYHPVGTCRMGSDPLSVVDSSLRVHGVDGSRVVDASIMPAIVGGNTNAPTIIIAEKAADMILRQPTTAGVRIDITGERAQSPAVAASGNLKNWLR
jgi:choline dehydrogenase